MHHLVPDHVVDRIQKAVLNGMGFIALHSAHVSKPLIRLLGTSCTLKWRDNDRERVWITSPSHPIAAGLPEYFELPQEEMYGEYFDIPTPDEANSSAAAAHGAAAWAKSSISSPGTKNIPYIITNMW